MKKIVLATILINFIGIASAAESQWHLSFHDNEFHVSSDDSLFGKPNDLVIVPNFENDDIENISFTGHSEAFIIRVAPELGKEYYIRIESQPKTKEEIRKIGEDLVAKFANYDAYDAFSHDFFADGFLLANTMDDSNNIHVFIQINGKIVIFRYIEPGGKSTLANIKSKVETFLDSLVAANNTSG